MPSYCNYGVGFGWPAGVLVVLLLMAQGDSHAIEKPLWELGLGIGGVHQPCYVGTRQRCNNGFPVVLPIYRGEFFKSDEKGVRAELVEEERYRFHISADFNFAVDSDDIDQREDMPDIDNLLQLGPSFEYTTYRDDSTRIFLAIPLRLVFEIDGSGVDSAGYTLSPGIVCRRQLKANSWRVTTSIRALFRTEAFNSLYYTVQPQFARAGRPAYRAGGGFSGARLQLAFTSNTPRNLTVLFIRYDNISGSVFEDSPLVETNESFSVGLLFSHYLFKSATKVIR